MTTMATTGHGLSVFANNSITNPIDPRTGKIASLSKPLGSLGKQHNDGIFNRSEAGIYIKVSPNRNVNTSNLASAGHGKQAFIDHNYSGTGSGNVTHVSSNLQYLSDEDFYEKLSKMKEQQRRQLEQCEKLYLEKRALEEKYSSRLPEKNTILDNDEVDIDTGTMLVNGAFRNHALDSNFNYNDRIYDYTSKPPVGPSPSYRPPSRQGKRPTHFNTSPVKNGYNSNIKNSEQSPINLRTVKSRSLDGDFRDLKDFDDSSDDEIGEYMRSPGYLSDDADTLIRREEVITPSKLELQRIESMWDDFAISDYAPRQRPSSAPSTRRVEKQKTASNWRHKLTIPQPFNMTLREESKVGKKSLAQIEVEAQRLRKEREEEIECQKKFKAKPVPAHVYLPLYDEINEKSEAKRRHVRQYCQELLKSQEQPFKFMKREEYKLMQRTNSEPNLNASKRELRESKKFKAKPVPSFVYDDKVSRKQMEEEEYRKLRICMRSEELLKEASLPPGMAAREKIKQQKILEKKRQAKARKYFRPKIHKRVPDYDALYSRFQQDLARRKTEISPTIMEPFRLETNRIHPDTEKVLRDMARDEESLVENRWPYRTPRSRTPTHTPRPAVHSSMDMFPAKMTKASETRKSTIRQSLEKQREDHKREEEAERHRRLRQSKLSKTIQEKAGDTTRTKQFVRDRIRQFKNDERLREEQYQSEMDAMKERVDEQPLLFERQRQKNAKNRAEKKFASTLRTVGLDEEFINSRSSAANSIRSGRDNYDDDDDDDDDYNDNVEATHTKSSDHYTDSFEED